MGNYFKIHYNAVKYPIDSEKSKGLRNAQLGAIHAISSFFTLNKKEAAIVIMPTGSGKTAVLMLTPYLIRKQRVLVVTPSKMVRGQIAEDFSELRTLCVANVFNTSIKKPKVFELEHLYTKEYQKDLEQADVIVATPSCALSLSESDWAKENIDLVEVDEAHHTPAKTWQQILVNLSVATHVLFTATPFRLDRKELSGEIVYDYPLSKAYEDGIFGEIQYVPVESGMDNDLCIAKRAEEVLLNDRKAGYEHYLMVRTDTKVSAEKLEELYKDNTSLKLSKVDSSMSNSKVKHILKLLHSGELDGIVCVDMLGEGYDFPNLKVAAIHVPHKSLASTLQFIGRFARTNAKNIGKAKFIAVNNEELEIENNLLYSKDAVEESFAEGKVVFFAGGTGHPYFSTDTATVLRAVEIGADAILLAKAVDGIYDSDPKVNPDAKKYDEISIDEVVAKKLAAMDLTASIMCMEQKMPMLVFGLDEKDSIVNTVHGKFSGTKVTV